MVEKAIQLRVYTPNRTVVDKTVGSVIFRACEGDMGVLPGHEPCSVMLGYGVLRAFGPDKQPADLLAVMGGYATVRDNTVTILSPMAAEPDKLEEAIAALERERAETRAHEKEADTEMTRMERALRRAMVHLDISSYSIIKGRDEQGDV